MTSGSRVVLAALLIPGGMVGVGFAGTEQRLKAAVIMAGYGAR
jgi:hypothetical protein